MKDTGYKPVTSIIRKRFIGYKLGRISKKYIDNMTNERRELLDFIKQIDHNITSTEELLSSYMPNMARMIQQKKARKQQTAPKQVSAEISEYWQEKRIQALERQEIECSICYQKLLGKPVVLLDCTHIYHDQCLESFERYDTKPVVDRANDRLNNVEKGNYGHACPMCRHPNYKKI
jgi:hypothetical protein